ncbi:MAG: SH3 domain-containing protein [Synergistaceae bacterium]|jgi:cell wall-associated NlpC family hydrolase|nr:SH3 domain-containing protein [Synergistaceae bacterium]
MLNIKIIYFVLTLFAHSVLPLCIYTDEADAATRFADLDRFPQSADAYLPMEPDELISSFSNQQIYSEEYLRNYFAPWQNDDLSYLDLSFEKIMNFQKITAGKQYYTADGKVFPRASLSKIASNGIIDPNATPRSGIVVSLADVRVLPTSTPLYSSLSFAKGQNGRLKLDVLQVSTIKPGEPLAIFCSSVDSDWLFVATGAVVGWIRAKNAALMDDDLKDTYMYSPHSVIIRDNLQITDQNNKILCRIKLGAVLPRDGGDLLLPERGKSGMAVLRRYTPADGAAASFPVPFTPRAAAAVMDQLMGEQYGWGGMNGFRDCSSMTRDYFSVFGVWLPRNSGDQAKTGAVIPLSNTPSEGRPGVIVSNAVPYATLIHMPGHIMLYIGLYDGVPVVFHNTWGVRTNSGRAVVGRAVVSGLRLGEELPNRPANSLLIDRIDSLVFPIANIRIK